MKDGDKIVQEFKNQVKLRKQLKLIRSSVDLENNITWLYWLDYCQANKN